MGRGVRLPAIEAMFVATAALGCLQPGIDPVFLTLLTAAHPSIALEDHGWVVGATQLGAALGALLVWRSSGDIPPWALSIAAAGALAAGLMTVLTIEREQLIGWRGAYGFAMGVIYTRAMSEAAASRPAGAYGAVFLIQLLLSTLVALVLPPMAKIGGPGLALAMLMLAPGTVLMLSLSRLRAGRSAHLAAEDGPEPGRAGQTPVSGWAFAVANVCFVSATMMIWSFTGALAAAAAISEQMIGIGVAAGSIAGAVTAIAVMREMRRVPILLTGALSACALLAPLFMIGPGRDALFVLAVVLLNIGSTAAIVRCSGLATAAAGNLPFRRLVASTHSFGMIAGPALGSVVSMAMGVQGLKVAAGLVLAVACSAIVLASSGVRTIARAPAAGLRDF